MALNYEYGSKRFKSYLMHVMYFLVFYSISLYWFNRIPYAFLRSVQITLHNATPNRTQLWTNNISIYMYEKWLGLQLWYRANYNVWCSQASVGNTRAPNASEGLAPKPQQIHASQSLAVMAVATQSLHSRRRRRIHNIT